MNAKKNSKTPWCFAQLNDLWSSRRSWSMKWRLEATNPCLLLGFMATTIWVAREQSSEPCVPHTHSSPLLRPAASFVSHVGCKGQPKELVGFVPIRVRKQSI